MSVMRNAVLTAAVTASGLVQVPSAVASVPALPAQCSGTAPIRCHFDVSPGNYDVTVELGSSTRAANTSMSVEARRQILTAASTSAGQVVRTTVTVNVRNPEGQKPLIKSRDLVFIQLGHNDKETTATVFRDNLTRLVNGVRERGGVPVLMTPPVRRLFNGSRLTSTALHVNNRGVDLPSVIRALGRSANVPVIDLTAKSKALVESLGPSASQPLYLTREAGDNTHFSVYGATQMSNLAVQGVRELNLSLAAYLR